MNFDYQMSATCLYKYSKGQNIGQYCPIHPKYGNYCYKHKKHDKNTEEFVNEMKKKSLILRKLRDGTYLCKDTKIVYKNNNPIGIYNYANQKVYPLCASDIEKLNIEMKYEIDTQYFHDIFYPRTLTNTIPPYVFNYSHVVDPETLFVYSYDQDFDVFNFYGIFNCLTKITSQDFDENMIQLFNIVDLYNIKPNSNRKRPQRLQENKEENKEENIFTLYYKTFCTFYKAEHIGDNTCLICYEKKSLYYNSQCEQRHYCCKNCWKFINDNKCPYCRINIYK